MAKFSQVVRSVKAFTDAFLNAPTDPGITATRPRIGLALGGGFARGLAHIGVLRVLEEEGIPVDYVAGTSVGAVLGAMYCSGVSVREMTEVAHLVRFRDFARWTVSRFGFCSSERMVSFLAKLVKCTTFEELRIPLAVAATDFVTGEGVVFRSGSLCEAIRASCAYPGMFLPMQYEGRLLVDGLLAYPVPAKPAREMGAERVISVYLSAHWFDKKGPRHVFDVIGQCLSIAQARMAYLWKDDSDVVIEPNLIGFGYDAFERAPEIIRVGEEATRPLVPMIKKWLQLPAVQPQTVLQQQPAMQPVQLPQEAKL
jgi:NTE family protein